MIRRRWRSSRVDAAGEASRRSAPKLNRRDTEALYYLGATEGLKAAFEGAVERSFMSALRNGSDSVDRHREVIKLEPAFHDAEITIGMYDYIVGSLPLPVKLLATIGGIRGSKKRGLATLERVAREGNWARDDAKVLLIALFKREKRYTEALALARELAAKYPRNTVQIRGSRWLSRRRPSSGRRTRPRRPARSAKPHAFRDAASRSHHSAGGDRRPLVAT